MAGKVLMIQGTASNVGKSVLVTALCRIFKQEGLSVAPFKAQNMSNNSYVTPDGGEIGRAQAVQAEAAGIQPSVEMNPILLKPEANSRSQVVVLGRPEMSLAAADYYRQRPYLWPIVTGALRKLRSQYDIVVIEGAGSPAEINLSGSEIVNMRLARHCRAPVLLVGDIDRGGVFAALLGTLWLLKPGDRNLIKAMVINKFRGDPSLLDPGLRLLEKKAGIPVAGVIPYFQDIHIAQEDSVALEQVRDGSTNPVLDIAIIRLPHISNFDDFDPLHNEKDISVRYVTSTESLGVPDLVVLPGSKTTISDLSWLEERGLAHRIIELGRQGVFIIGICGGYQMLGEYIRDPLHVESDMSSRKGLGLLPVTTRFLHKKETHQVRGEVLGNRGLLDGIQGQPFEGYEIHMGKTANEGEAAFRVLQRSDQPCDVLDGYLDATGRVLGTYIHGLFHNQSLRQSLLRHVACSRNRAVSFCGDVVCGGEYDRLADLVRDSLDMERIYLAAGILK